MVTNAIEVDHVTKRYGEIFALDDVSLDVPRGSIFGIIGPNGSGKSTLVNVLAGLRPPSAGTVAVLGLDPERAGRKLRERIGLQLQDARLQDQLTVREAVELYAWFYRKPAPWRPLVHDWGLDSKLTARFSQRSGGQKQRLLICLALINQLELVIFDELTTGLDPTARRESWEHIRRIRDLGTTVILVTHFMEEALTNVRKHVSAISVVVTLTNLAGELALDIHDDGVGFDAGNPGTIGTHSASGTEHGMGLGLATLGERIHSLGGVLTI